VTLWHWVHYASPIRTYNHEIIGFFSLFLLIMNHSFRFNEVVYLFTMYYAIIMLPCDAVPLKETWSYWLPWNKPCHSAEIGSTLIVFQ